jgi:hypothetical protein
MQEPRKQLKHARTKYNYCKKCKANRLYDNYIVYQLNLRSLRDTLGVFQGLYIYIRSG